MKIWLFFYHKSKYAAEHSVPSSLSYWHIISTSELVWHRKLSQLEKHHQCSAQHKHNSVLQTRFSPEHYHPSHRRPDQHRAHHTTGSQHIPVPTISRWCDWTTVVFLMYSHKRRLPKQGLKPSLQGKKEKPVGAALPLLGAASDWLTFPEDQKRLWKHGNRTHFARAEHVSCQGRLRRWGQPQNTWFLDL